MLSDVLTDQVNTYVTPFKGGIVNRINSKTIRTLQDVASAFEEPGEFHVIELLGEGRPIVLDRSTLKDASARIKERYGVSSDQNL